jgi:hypothetical protein
LNLWAVHKQSVVSSGKESVVNRRGKVIRLDRSGIDAASEGEELNNIKVYNAEGGT